MLQEKNTALHHSALEELRRQIRSSTTSMTSVPKPLKFLRPHYGKLKEIYEGMAAGENKVSLLVSMHLLGLNNILQIYRHRRKAKKRHITPDIAINIF